jgi:hypothetical protein
MFMGCVIGRRSMTIRLYPSGLAKNMLLDSISRQIGAKNYKK